MLEQCDEHGDSANSMSSFTSQVATELRLRMYRNGGTELLKTMPNVILEQITSSNSGSRICNAEAFYQLGLLALFKAREQGELCTLWSEHATGIAGNGSCRDGFSDAQLSSTTEARECFRCALSNAPPASCTLTKNILRCLALVSGPRQQASTAAMVHMSIGGAARQIVRDSLDGGSVQNTFSAFDDESLDFDARIEAVGQLLLNSAPALPRNWNVVAMATCPTGELLVSSLRASPSGGEQPTEVCTVCVFASTPADCDSSAVGIHAEILHPLDRIIDRSQKQLHGITEEAQQGQYNEKSSRRDWWKERYSIDEDLHSLLKAAETTYFGRDPVRQRLIPDDLFVCRQPSEAFPANDEEDDSSDCSDLGPGNLASKFAAAELEAPVLPTFDEEAERLNLAKLTVASIKAKLATFGVAEGGLKKMRKADLIDLLLREMMEGNQGSESKEDASPTGLDDAIELTGGRAQAPQHEEDQTLITPGEPCTILVLDEHLHRFPLESMDMLSNVAITRVPSLAFVFATLREAACHPSAPPAPAVDPRKVSYVLDPESNLSESASTLAPALTSMASENGWKWDGVVGEMPSLDFMAQALTEENGLYLYCGHGGGEKAFSRSRVEDLISRGDGIRGCRSIVVLMGCSSGKLLSVNTPKDMSINHPSDGLHYEPEGIALSYLYAGAPCVVGNLWDVTDRDIDRWVDS